VAFDDATIGRHDVSIAQLQDISGHDILHGDGLCLRLLGSVGMADNGCGGRSNWFEIGDRLPVSSSYSSHLLFQLAIRCKPQRWRSVLPKRQW
jgi:hypothetical protein